MRSVDVDEPFHTQLILQVVQDFLILCRRDEIVHMLLKRIPLSNDVEKRWVLDLLQEVETATSVLLHHRFCVRELTPEGCIVGGSRRAILTLTTHRTLDGELNAIPMIPVG